MNAPSPPGPHPLATRLAQRYRELGRTGPILDVGTGSGRNTHYLNGLGFTVTATSDDEPYTQIDVPRAAFDAAISTHAYLHGAVAKLRLGLGELRRVLAPGSPVALVFGSIDDARFGFGIPFDDQTFAPGDGAEAGIPHAYFDRAGVEELLRASFRIDRLEEVDVDQIVGRWAHGDDEIAGYRHWFVEAIRT
jgi:hypothetical protein